MCSFIVETTYIFASHVGIGCLIPTFFATLPWPLLGRWKFLASGDTAIG